MTVITYNQLASDSPYLSAGSALKNNNILSSTTLREHGHRTRCAHHFQNNPRPKFVLSSGGDILDLNIAASRLMSEGLLKRRADGKLDLGALDLNTSAMSIIEDIRSGRAECKQLLKRLPDNDWMVLHFFKIANADSYEILLSVKQGGLCPRDSLDALSKAFGFTVTESVVVSYMAKAYCPKEIGAQMNISINTVRAHLRSIYSKIGVRGYNRALRLVLQLQA